MTVSVETISFEVSQDLLASLKVGAKTLGQQIRVLAAVAYFHEKKLSLGKAAQLYSLRLRTIVLMVGARQVELMVSAQNRLYFDLPRPYWNVNFYPKTV